MAEAVERHITEFGVSEFTVGNYGSFDRMAAKAVIAAKVRHPGIMLFLLLPYHPAERPAKTPLGFDGTFYPPGMENVPRRIAIVHANRYMVDHADHLIAFLRHSPSNTGNLVQYAYAQKTIQKRTVTLL